MVIIWSSLELKHEERDAFCKTIHTTSAFIDDYISISRREEARGEGRLRPTRCFEEVASHC